MAPIDHPAMRRPGMAIACVGAIVLSVAGMYIAGKDSKAKEGHESAYQHGGKGGTDMKMNSSDVSAVVSLPRPGDKTRVPDHNVKG